MHTCTNIHFREGKSAFGPGGKFLCSTRINSYQKAFILFAESLSPEVQQSMDAAMEAMAKSKAIRKEVIEVIDHTQRMQTAAHSAVNEGLVRKLAQTVTLTVSTPLVRIILSILKIAALLFLHSYISPLLPITVSHCYMHMLTITHANTLVHTELNGGYRISFKGAPFIVMRAKRARKFKNRTHFMLNHAHLRHIAGKNRATSESVYAQKLSKGKLQQDSLST